MWTLSTAWPGTKPRMPGRCKEAGSKGIDRSTDRILESAVIRLFPALFSFVSPLFSYLLLMSLVSFRLSSFEHTALRSMFHPRTGKLARPAPKPPRLFIPSLSLFTKATLLFTKVFLLFTKVFSVYTKIFKSFHYQTLSIIYIFLLPVTFHRQTLSVTEAFSSLTKTIKKFLIA
jgi:hypothetical protein